MRQHKSEPAEYEYETQTSSRLYFYGSVAAIISCFDAARLSLAAMSLWRCEVCDLG